MNVLDCVGSAAFGVVLGWITYRTLRRTQGTGLSDIATVLGVVGGATVTGLFPREGGSFSWYAIGVALGFFGYVVCCMKAPARIVLWMGEDSHEFPPGERRQPPPPN
jgi:NhaP-type Na+/H+ or K+/H+ antiporter